MNKDLKELRETIPFRQTEYPVHFLFPSRWSPRAMSGEPIEHDDLMALFEAARWAPSSYNNQPWRFLYATRESEFWPIYFKLLEPGNQEWARKAGALILLISKKTFDNGKPSKTHSFDAGSAWENMALQGFLNGLVIHGMEGFDYQKARKEMKIPDNFDIEAMVAVGRHGGGSDLPESYQEKEIPSSRKSFSEFVFEGTM